MLADQYSGLPLRMRFIGMLRARAPGWTGKAAALLFLGCALFLLRRPEIKEAAKRAWSRWDVQRAQTLLHDEATAPEGVRLLRDALVRTPAEPEVVRALARLTAESGLLAHARFFYLHPERLHAMTPADRLQHTAVVARLNDHSGAQLLLQTLARQEGETANLWRAQAHAATARGDHAAAHAALTKVLAAAPEDSAANLDLAKTGLFSVEARQQHTGITQLLDVLEKSLHDFDPSQRNACLWTLSALTIEDADQRARCAKLIGQIGWQKVERQVLRHLLEWSRHPADTGRRHLRASITSTLHQHPGTGPAERLSVVKMLQHHGEHDLALDWVTQDFAQRDAVLCAARLDSLFALHQWNAAAALINHRGPPLPSTLRFILSAQLELLSTQGRSPNGDVLLEKALIEARKGGQQSAFVALGRLAAEFGRHQTAYHAYAEAMAPRHPAAQFLLEAFFRAARAGGASAAEVLRLLEARDAMENWSQEWRRHITYYRVLCGERMELAEDSIRAWSDTSDAEAHFQLAFLAMRLGNTPGLRSLLPKLPASHSWTPAQRVILRAMHRSLGTRAFNAQHSSSPPALSSLFPEERRFL